MTKEEEKLARYGHAILCQIEDLFNDEDDYSYIGREELSKDNNLTIFFHALATAAPTVIYNKITGDHKNQLEFNHLANQLCFQFYIQKNTEENE